MRIVKMLGIGVQVDYVRWWLAYTSQHIMTMTRTIALLFLVVLGSAKANPPYIPPDYYHEKYLPSIGFWENRGQVIGTDGSRVEDVEYYTTGSIPQAYLRDKSKISFALHVVDTIAATVDTVYHLQMEPWGDHARSVTPQGAVLKGEHLNYLLPHCGSTGITQVQGYSRVLYEEFFPYIDLHFYSGGFGQKMAFVCRPGADLSHLLLRFTGQDSLNQDLWGNLQFYHDGKYFVLPHAVAYQVDSDDTTIPVGWNAVYDPDGDAGTVRFQWGAYDPAKPLVFQIGPPPAMGGTVNTPGVCWSTYLGGNGVDRIYASDVDDDGNYYVGGYTNSTAIYFPVNTGMIYVEAIPMTAFVSKFDDVYGVRWTTFYGGSHFPGTVAVQYVCGLKARPGPNTSVLAVGISTTSDLHIADPGHSAYLDASQPYGGGFVLELNTNGRAVWSTYFDPSAAVLNVDVHPTGAVAIVGSTGGVLPEEQVPPPAGAAQWAYSGGQDGFIAQFDPDRQLTWATYVGGPGSDMLKAVKYGEGKIVAAGESTSTSFQQADGGPNAHDAPFAGGNDVILLEFKLTGEQLWGTYVGGSGGENLGYQGLALGPSAGTGKQDVFIVGSSSSTDLPFVAGPNWYDHTPKSGLQGFVARFSGEDRSLQWMTFAKGTGTNTASTHWEAVVVDPQERIYLGGSTTDVNYVTHPSPGVYSETTRLGPGDGALMCFSNDQVMLWSTFFGGAEGGRWATASKPLLYGG